MTHSTVWAGKYSTALHLEVDVGALTNFFSTCHLSLRRAGCAGPHGCPCHPSHTTRDESCPEKSTSWDRSCFTSSRHLAWCSLSSCSVSGWRRDLWMRDKTRDSDSKTINWSQITQSHYMPLNHSLKLQHLVRKCQGRCHVLNLMSFHLKSKLKNSLKIPTCFSLHTSKITPDFNTAIHLL